MYKVNKYSSNDYIEMNTFNYNVCWSLLILKVKIKFLLYLLPLNFKNLPTIILNWILVLPYYILHIVSQPVSKDAIDVP